MDYKVAKNKYGVYCVPTSSLKKDKGSQRIMNGGVWEEETVQFLKRANFQGDIIHAGTFFGDHLPPLSEYFETVWTFEPVTEHYECALKTIEWNDLNNIELYKYGLSDKKQKLSIVVGGDSDNHEGGRCSIVNKFNVSNPLKEEIELVTIDEVYPEDRNLSVIHLDIEGYEQIALTGALKTIKMNKPVILVETLPSKKWIVDNLESLGYNFREQINVNHIFSVEPLPIIEELKKDLGRFPKRG